MALAQSPEKGLETGDKYDDHDPYKTVNGARLMGGISAIGGLVLAMSTIPVLASLEDYNNLKLPFSATNSPLAFELSLPFVILAAGVFDVLVSMLLVVGYYKHSRGIAYLGMILILIASAVGLFGALKVQRTLDQMFSALQGNPVTNADNFEDTDLSAMDMTAAVFNTCCFSEYDSLNYLFPDGTRAPLTKGGSNVDLNQRAVVKCASTLEATCSTGAGGDTPMFPAIVGTVLQLGGSDLNNLLCHCFSDQERYDAMVDVINSNDLCTKYRKVIVPGADARVVPVINLKMANLITALGLAFDTAISAELPMKSVAYVGKVLPPAQIYQEPPEDIGFSCGLGYAKADALYLYFYITDRTDIMNIIAIVGACISIATGVTLPLYWLVGGSSAEEDLLEYEKEQREEENDAFPTAKTFSKKDLANDL